MKLSSIKIFEKYKLPRKIKVNVKVTDEGYFFAELPEYRGCFTEAKNFSELIKNVTDAVLTYFNVPSKESNKLDIVYLPPEILTPNKEPIDELIEAQENKLGYNNIAVQFNYFTSLQNGVNSFVRS